MPILFTATAKVANWEAFARLEAELKAQLQAQGLQPFHVYRNLYDAGQMLVFIGLPDLYAAQQVVALLQGQCQAALCGGIKENIWEITAGEV